MEDVLKTLGLVAGGGTIGTAATLLIRSAMKRSDQVDARYDNLIENLTERLDKVEGNHDECLEQNKQLRAELATVVHKVNVIEQASSKH